MSAYPKQYPKQGSPGNLDPFRMIPSQGARLDKANKRSRDVETGLGKVPSSYQAARSFFEKTLLNSIHSVPAFPVRDLAFFKRP